MIKEMEAWDVVDECTRNNLTRRQSQSLDLLPISVQFHQKALD